MAERSIALPQAQADAARKPGSSMMRLLDRSDLAAVYGGADTPSDPTPPAQTNSAKKSKSRSAKR